MGQPTVRSGPDFKQGIPLQSLKSGQKILGQVDGSPVLLINENEKFYAVGALCSHYSANLNDGIIVEGTLRCPWHHACFDLETGEAKKAPALNPIPTWEVEVRESKIYITNKRNSEKSKEPLLEKAHFVIIGSGAAGQAAAEMLRREGFAGRLTVLSEDDSLPYDRPAKPQIKGIDLPHVHFLRSFSDCKSILQALPKTGPVAIIGAGFIGLESAAALRARGLDVTIIAPNSLPLAHVVGKEAGRFLLSVHEKNGVHFFLNHNVEKIENGFVVLNNGK